MSAARVKKVVVFTDYRCNNRCVFCIDACKRDLPPRGTKEVLRDVYRAARAGAGYLELIGGEAPIRPDFLQLVRTARRLGIPKIVTATNGRAFALRSFAEAAVRAGLTDVMFSLHGDTAAVHDRATRSPGSFRQLLAGIENLRRLGFSRIHGNTTVYKGNLARVPAIARLYARLRVEFVEYIFVDPTYGGAHEDFARLVPRISQAAPRMRAALEVGRRAGYREWLVRYVPLCHFRGWEEQVSERVERRLFHTRHWAPDFRNEDVGASRARIARRKPPRCRPCALYKECEGIWTEYLRRYGDAELHPVPKPKRTKKQI